VAAFILAQAGGQEGASAAGGQEEAQGGQQQVQVQAVGASAQYLVVSHKPQVFEQAGCLVGVYSAGGSASAVVARFV
jgi:hypothetical protein